MRGAVRRVSGVEPWVQPLRRREIHRSGGHDLVHRDDACPVRHGGRTCELSGIGAAGTLPERGGFAREPRGGGPGIAVNNLRRHQLSGKVEYRNYDLNVSNVYNVSGDVDVGTGSIDFNGDVEINGSVRGSVKIHAMGNIYIGGYVEDADIWSGQDIIIQDGVNAGENGRIEAMGNISARFFENAHIISHSDIKCDYMLNTTALAYGGIYLEGKRGSVIGGDVTGVRGICIKACGSESYSKTVLRVGVTKEISSEYAKVLMVLKDIDTQIDRFNQALQKLDILKKAGSDKFDETLNRKLLQSKIVKTAEKAKYEEKSRNLYTLVRESDRAVVRIDKNIYPGSRVFMGDKTYVPSTVFTHIALKKTSQGVLIRNYDSM